MKEVGEDLGASVNKEEGEVGVLAAPAGPGLGETGGGAGEGQSVPAAVHAERVAKITRFFNMVQHHLKKDLNIEEKRFWLGKTHR